MRQRCDTLEAEAPHHGIYSTKYIPDRPTEEALKGVRLELNVTTYNPACFAEITNERRPKGKRQARAMRLQAVRAQLHELGVVLAGFQEMRGRAGKYTEDGCLHVTSGGRNNNHGVGFLINLVRPYATTGTRELRLQERHVRVTHSESTRMIIKIRAPHLDMILLVAHAPQSGVATAVRKEWWGGNRQTGAEVGPGLDFLRRERTGQA